jgi:hypothetical protein
VIFSNLVTSGMLAALAGSHLLLNLLKSVKNFKLKDYVKENAFWLIVLVMWIISAIYELSGGRASGASGTSLLVRIREVAYFLKEILVGANPLFWLIVFTITGLALLQFLLTRKKGNEEATILQLPIPLFVAAAALLIYMLAICAMVWTESIYRVEYQFPILFYGFLVVFLALGYLVKKQPKLMMILPLLIVFLASDVNTNGKTFNDSLMSDYGAKACADVSRDIVSQFMAAEEAGLTEANIYIPQHVADPESQDNWPHSVVLLHWLNANLYEQGILSHPISVTYVIDPAVNQRNNIPLPIAVTE